MGLSLLSGFKSSPVFSLLTLHLPSLRQKKWICFGKEDQFKWKILTTPFRCPWNSHLFKWIKDKISLTVYAMEHNIEPGFIFSAQIPLKGLWWRKMGFLPPNILIIPTTICITKGKNTSEIRKRITYLAHKKNWWQKRGITSKWD